MSLSREKDEIIKLNGELLSASSSKQNLTNNALLQSLFISSTPNINAELRPVKPNHPNLNQIIYSLNPTEEKSISRAITYAQGILAEGDSEEINEMTSILMNYPYLFTLRMCQKSNVIHDFCYRNEKLNNFFSAELKSITNEGEETNHPNIRLHSMDGQLSYSPFHLYVAGQFESISCSDKLSDEYKIPKANALNYACHLGLFDALLVRAQNSYNQMKELFAKKPASSSDTNQIVNLLKSVIKDYSTLINIYQSPGYLQAGFQFYALAHQSSLSEEQTSALLNHSIKSFLCANILKSDDVSKQIMHNIYGENAEKRLLQKFLDENGIDHEVNEIQDVCNYFYNLIGKDNYNNLEKTAKQEIDARIIMLVDILPAVNDGDSYGIQLKTS